MVNMGINGFGRIGRLVFRAATENKAITVRNLLNASPSQLKLQSSRSHYVDNSQLFPRTTGWGDKGRNLEVTCLLECFPTLFFSYIFSSKATDVLCCIVGLVSVRLKEIRSTKNPRII
jgi:hypothetical protein